MNCKNWNEIVGIDEVLSPLIPKYPLQILWNPASEKVLLIWFFPSGDIGRILHKFPKKLMGNPILCVTQVGGQTKMRFKIEK